MILVFGGTGFIGKNLLAALHASGEQALAVSRNPDNEFLRLHAPSSRAMSTVDFYRDPAAALSECHAVVYLASNSVPGSNLDEPWKELHDNIDPLMRLLAAVQECRPQSHMVFLSSGGTVYGRQDQPLIREDMPLRPISAYGLGKKMMESAVTFMADQHGLKTTILRPGNPVGLWQKSHNQGIVGVLMRAAISGDEFPLLGDGSAIRDYFDVADLVTAIRLTIACPRKSVGEIFNVGSGTGLSVSRMLETVERVSGRKIRIRMVAARSSDIDRVVLDTSHIRTRMEWQPQHKLEDTLTKIWSDIQGCADR